MMFGLKAPTPLVLNATSAEGALDVPFALGIAPAGPALICAAGVVNLSANASAHGYAAIVTLRILRKRRKCERRVDDVLKLRQDGTFEACDVIEACSRKFGNLLACKTGAKLSLDVTRRNTNFRRDRRRPTKAGERHLVDGNSIFVAVGVGRDDDPVFDAGDVKIAHAVAPNNELA